MLPALTAIGWVSSISLLSPMFNLLLTMHGAILRFNPLWPLRPPNR